MKNNVAIKFNINVYTNIYAGIIPNTFTSRS